MTALAGQIARGRRGDRLSPTRTETELGRAAAAFDVMLDALEGAETQAWSSEERTRRFVADAAHELRTPITGIAAAAEAMLHYTDGADAEQRQRLELLLMRESHRAARLVDDLVNLACLDAGIELHREPVELCGLAPSRSTESGYCIPRSPSRSTERPGGGCRRRADQRDSGRPRR